MKRIVSPKLQRSARGQDCTLEVAGVCNYNPDTVVLAHIQVDGGKMGGKTDDISACFGCSDCHAWVDQYLGTEEDRLFYTRRAMVRTWIKWIEQGLIKL
jgi:hypothetical protein